MQDIPVFKPVIEASEFKAASDALELGWLGMGGYVGDFEKALAQFIGIDDRFVVAVSTGHAALHLGLLLLDLKPGDEVITPAFNNIADFQAILAAGGTPVMCDIRDDTLCIDVNKASELVTEKTKAIVGMDYDCCLVDHSALNELARQKELRVIHDAAHSFGSRYNGKKIGSFSDICMFSFDPVKTITCIDGGALIVRTEEEKEILHEMRLIGMTQSANVMYGNQRAWTYDVKRVGFRYHMANLHAAIGLSQISKMTDISRTRQAACRLYNTLLQDVTQIRTPQSNFTEVTPFLYYIRVDEEFRQPLRNHLKSNGIDTGIHWQPGHWFSLFKDVRHGDLSTTDRVGAEILSLPLHSMMEASTVQRICTQIKTFFT